MLVYQNHGSQGSAGNAVKLTSRSYNSATLFTGPCSSGLKFGLNGVLSKIQANGGFSAVSGEWLLAGVSSAFWIQRTIISGTLETDSGDGFLVMSTDRTYENLLSVPGTKVTEVFFEISSDSSGVPVVETATMTFTSFFDSGE